MKKKVIVSRDVIFAEDEAWKWDVDARNDTWRHPILEEGIPEVVVPITNEEASSNSAQETTALGPIETGRPRIQCQPPISLRDFEVTSDNAIDGDGNLVHLDMFANCTPVTFEEAI